MRIAKKMMTKATQTCLRSRGKADKKKATSKKDKKSKEKKKKKRKTSSDSSDDSKSSDDADLELFGDAGRGTIGLASKLERIAARRPGRLLRFTLDAMHRSLRRSDNTCFACPTLHS